MTAALRSLRATMDEIEIQHKNYIAGGERPTDVDRDIAQYALAIIIQFFLDHRIESQPIYRLFHEIAALSAGASPSAMLAPAKTRHRRPDAPAIENIKGRLAAIMEYRQHRGMARKAACDWVVKHVPLNMKLQIRAMSPAAVNSWLVKWGGRRGATPGPGRDGYLAMISFLQTHQPNDKQLQRIISPGLSKSLPSGEFR